MLGHKSKNRHDKERILDDVIKIIEEMDSGWESQFELSMRPETLLGADLGFKSIDIVRLVAAIQKLYNHCELPFQELFIPSGRPVKDLSVLDVVVFLNTHINHHI